MARSVTLNGKYTEAITILERAVQEEPNNTSACLSLGIAYAKDGNEHGATGQPEPLKTLDEKKGAGF